MKNILLLIALLLFGFNTTAQCNADAGADTAICIGSTLQLGAIPAGSGPGTLSYSWSPAAGLSCTNCPNPTVTVSSSQTYTLTVSSSTGCSATSNIHISALAAPTAAFNINGNNNCANLPVTFTNNSSGTGLSYSWNFGDPGSGTNTSSATNPSHTFSATGTGAVNYTVTLVVTNSAGCSASSNASVTALATPGPTLVDPIAGMRNCDGSNFAITLFDASATTAISNYTIQWGDGTADYSSSTFPGSGVNHTYVTAEIFSLNYIITGTNGCTDTTQYNIANITNPAIGAANPGATTGCGPVTLCFPLNNYSSNHPTTFYVVDYGDGSPKDTLPHPPPASICHTYTSSSCGLPGNQFVFRMKAINMCDSSEASISPIRVYTGPTANFNPAAVNNCVGSTVTFINSSQTGFNSSCSSSTLFQWNFGDGQTATSTTATNVTHVYSLPGTYTVTLTTVNSCNTNTITRTVCIENPPTPAFSINPATNCIPFISQVTDNSILTNTCNVTRLWTVLFNGSPCLPSSGTYTFVGGTSASSVNPQIQFTQPGNYSLRLTLTNSCGSFISNQPIVAQAPPQVSINPIPSICAGLSVSPTAVVNDCLEPSDNYLWNFIGGNPTSSSTLIPGSITYSSAGTFPITLAVTNACGTTTVSGSVVIKPIPPILNPQVNSPLCVGNTANFTSDLIPGIVYSWTGPNALTNSNQNFNLTNINLTQAGTYSLTGTLNGCIGPSSSINLIVNPIPVISVSPASATLCIGESIDLTASGASTYTWSPAMGLSTTTGSSVTAAPLASQTYTIIGNDGICSGSTSVTVTINPLPVVNAGPDITLCNQSIPYNLTPSPTGGTWSGVNVTSSGIFTPNGIGTYYLIYSFTNATNCTSTDTIQVTVTNPTPAYAGIDDTVCLSSTTMTWNGTPTGGTWSGTNITSTGVFTPNLAGNFSLVYTYGTGTCLSRDTALVNVNSLPVVNAGSDFAVCIDAAVQLLVGTPLGGTWNGTGITNSTGEFTPNIAGTGVKNITYTYSDSNGCINTDNVLITVNPLPIVSAGPDTTACNQPTSFQLSCSPVGGTWSGLNVNSSGLFTPNGVGTFTLTYTYTNTNGCTASDTRDVTIIDPTQPNAGTDFNVCIDAPNLTLTPTPLGGTWTGSFVNSGGIFNPTNAGTFPLVYTFGSGACLQRDTVLGIVNPLPVVDAGNNYSICIDAGLQTLSGNPAGGTWSGTGISNPAGEFDPSLAGAGLKTLTYSYTDLNGCSNSANLILTVNPLPIVNAGNDTTLCNQPISVQLNGIPVNGTWSGSGVTSSGIFTPSTVGNFTLTYTFVNANGCVNSDDRIISVVNPTQANAGPDLSICIDAANVQLNGSPSSATWNGNYVTTSGIFDPTVAGNFSIILSNGAGNCLTHDTVVITVNPLPILTVNNDVEFCPSDSSVNLTGSPLNGTWSGNGITNTTLGTFNPAAAPIGTNVIIYSYTDPITGCINKDSLNALIHPMPIANFTNNPISCIGVSEAFTNSSTFTAISAWDFGDGNTSSLFSPNHSYSSPGFYTVKLHVTTLFGCMDSIEHPIEVRIPPVADFSLVPDSACGPFAPTIIDSSLGQNLSYQWIYGNGQTSTDSIPIIQTYVASNYSDTSYTLTLNLTNFCGVSSHVETITVMPSPTAIFGTNTNIGCTPLVLDFVNNSYGLVDQVVWNFGDGNTSMDTSSTLQHVFYTGITDTTYILQLIVSNECGTDTVQHHVTVVPPQVNAFFNIDAPDGCVSHTINLTQFSQGALFSSWDFGDGNTSTQYNPSHTYTNPGTYLVSLYAAGCGFDTTTTTVTVHPLPQIDFTLLDSSCVNQEVDFVNTSTNIASVDWNFGDGTTSQLNNPTHIYTTPGIYTVTLSGISQTYGCSTQISHTIQVNPIPNAAMTLGPNNGCVALTVQMTNASTGSVSQLWNFGDGNSTLQVNPTHTYTSSGSYAVELIAINALGCPDTAVQVVNVYPLPLVDFTYSTLDSCSQPSNFNFTNLSSNAVDYAWDFGNGLNATLTNPSTQYNQVGSYTVTLIGTSIHGCVDSIQKTVNSYQQASGNFTLPVDSICLGTQITLQASTQNSLGVQWMLGDGTIATGNPFQYTYNSSGAYNIALIVSGSGGCNDTTSATSLIHVLPQPSADFSYSNQEVNGVHTGQVNFSNLSIGGDLYTWDFGNGTSSNEENPTCFYSPSGYYTVLLITENNFGCSDTAALPIEVDFYYGLYIPNAISPGNSDFQVANFIPKGVGLKTFELLIYDDWGNLIWSTHALDANGRPTEYWDGTFNGVPVQQDAYVWKATATFLNEEVWEGKEYPNGKKKRSGTVTVIR